MEHKNTTVGGDSAITRRLKVPQNVRLAVYWLSFKSFSAAQSDIMWNGG